MGIGLWALGRGFVASTWRDPHAVGPLSAEQVIDLAVGATMLGIAVAATIVRRRPRGRVLTP